MGRRQDFHKTLNHQKPEKVIIDLGGTPQALLWGNSEAKMLDFLGMKADKYNEGLYIDERIQQYLDIDIRMTGAELMPKNILEKTISPTERIDAWGIRRKLFRNDWDICENPLRGATYEELVNYPWPNADTIDYKVIEPYKERAKYYYENTDYIVCVASPCYGVFELGCWMCGFDDFLYRMAAEPEFVHKLFEIHLKFQRKVIENYYKELGPYMHFTTSGDDFATQSTLFVSPKMFDDLISPYFEERISYTKSFTKGKFMHHSCGNVFNLIPKLISCGVDILNPIQPCAPEMDPESIKGKYGDKITFHGGIDTQYLLPNGTIDEVKAAVKKQLETMGENGGYILSAAHCIQDDVPTENIIAMFQAAREYWK